MCGSDEPQRMCWWEQSEDELEAIRLREPRILRLLRSRGHNEAATDIERLADLVRDRLTAGVFRY